MVTFCGAKPDVSGKSNEQPTDEKSLTAEEGPVA